MRPRTFALLTAALAVAAAGCDPVIRRDPPRTVAFAWFDPTTREVPTPTDLVRDEASGRLAIPLDDAALSPAERAFRAWLNTLDGYPTISTARVRFGVGHAPSRPTAIDPATIDATTVPVLDVTDGPEHARALEATRTLSTAGDELTIAPGDRWPHRRTVLIAVRGGPRGVRAADGAHVDADRAFYLLRGHEPIDRHADALPGATPAARLEAARRLEQVRLRFQPYFAALEAAGLPRDEVAVLWTFTTDRAREYMVYDPVARRIPFPNDILRENGRVVLPVEPTDSPEVRAIKEGLTGIDGFSTSAAITMATTVPVDPSTVTPDSVRLYELGGAEPVPVAALERRVQDDGRTVVLEPIDRTQPRDWRAPLRPGTTYMVVATDAVRGAGGQVLDATLFTELLKLRAPVAADGRSTLSVLSDESASRVEPLRAAVAGPLDWLEAHGLPRARVRLVFSFTTLGTVPVLRALNDRPWTERLPTDLRDVQARPPAAIPGLIKPMPHTGLIVTATMRTFERLERGTRRFAPDGAGRVVDIGLSLCIPRAATPGTPLPVTVFGHGLTTAKELVYLLCDDLARAGFATVAIDFPYHGERSICLNDSHCERGHHCASEAWECRDAQGRPAPVRRDAIIWSQGIPQPVSTGEGFVDMDDLFASRDHVQQSVIDMSALVRLVRLADWPAATGGYALDGTRINYLGISLGGILGSLMTAAEPRIGAAVLNVPGAGFVQLVQDSERFRDQFFANLAAHGVRPGTPEFFRFENAARWILDPADPMNFVRHARREPYAYLDPQDGATRTSPVKPILIQMATPDRVVPNTSTRLLARMYGQDFSHYRPVDKPGLGGHAFLFDPSEPEGARALDEALTFLRSH